MATPHQARADEYCGNRWRAEIVGNSCGGCCAALLCVSPCNTGSLKSRNLRFQAALIAISRASIPDLLLSANITPTQGQPEKAFIHRPRQTSFSGCLDSHKSGINARPTTAENAACVADQLESADAFVKEQISKGLMSKTKANKFMENALQQIGKNVFG